jgi:hypothetical protein
VFLVLLADGGDQVLAELLGALDFDGVGAGDVEVQRLVALVGAVLAEAGAAAFDLYAAARLLLDVLDVLSAVANDGGAQVEAGNRFQSNGYLLLRPLALLSVSTCVFAVRSVY